MRTGIRCSRAENNIIKYRRDIAQFGFISPVKRIHGVADVLIYSPTYCCSEMRIAPRILWLHIYPTISHN